MDTENQTNNMKNTFVQDIVPFRLFTELCNELILKDAQISGSNGYWEDREPIQTENLHKLQEMHLTYSTRSIFEVVKDESFLRTYWRADKDTREMTTPLDISSIGNDAPTDEKVCVVKSTFYRPNPIGTSKEYIKEWFSWFFGSVDGFKHMTVVSVSELDSIKKLYHLLVFDLFLSKIKNPTDEEYSIITRFMFERKTSREHDSYTQKEVRTYPTEYQIVRDGLVKKSKTLFICGSNCFFLVNKNGDSTVTKNEFLTILNNTNEKSLDTIITLEEKENPTVKESKKIILAYTALRTGIALKELLDILPPDVKVVVGTRGKDKVSVENYPYTGYDAGSGKVKLVGGDDIETITDIKKSAICEKYVTVTGGSYGERIQSATMIKNKVFENFPDLDETQKKKIFQFIQPIRPSVEKASLLPQRKLFSTDDYILMQSGNRDALIMQNGKFLGGVSVNLDDELKSYLKSYWK